MTLRSKNFEFIKLGALTHSWKA